MKIDYKLIGLIIIGAIFILIEIIKNILLPSLNVIFTMVPVILSIVLVCVYVGIDKLISKMQNSDSSSVKEALNLINYEKFFPDEIVKPINNVFQMEKQIWD